MAALSIAPVAMVDVIDVHYLLTEPPMPTASYWPSTIHSTPTSNIQHHIQQQKKRKMIFMLHGRPTPRNGALLGVMTDRSNLQIDHTTVRRQEIMAGRAKKKQWCEMQCYEMAGRKDSTLARHEAAGRYYYQSTLEHD